jgi:hypothetical protein
VGWQARSIGAPPPGTPKYLTMTGMKKTEVLYNYDTAKSFPYVVICEGPTDVWRVGPAGVALFGKTISTVQGHLVASGWGGGAAVVLLDADAHEEARRVHDALAGLVRHRVLVRLPEGKDPGDLTHEDLWRLIDETASRQGVTLPALEVKSSQEGLVRTVFRNRRSVMEDPFEPGSVYWRQSEALKRLLGEDTPTGHLSRYEAAGLIRLHDPNAAWRSKPPTAPQEKVLPRHNLWREGLTRGEAAELIADVKRRKGWI